MMQKCLTVPTVRVKQAQVFYPIKLAVFLASSGALMKHYFKKRTAACDEPFGCELRAERLSRVEYRISNNECRRRDFDLI